MECRLLGHLEEFLPVMKMQLTGADRPHFDGLVHPGNAVADLHNTVEAGAHSIDSVFLGSGLVAPGIQSLWRDERCC
jgi:hypothetical protein